MQRPRLGPERGHTLCASLRSQNACPHVTRDIRRATLYRNLQKKCRGPECAQNADEHLCASLRSRNACPRVTRHQKSHVIRKFTGKMPRPRLGPERRRTLCASLRSRNACQDVTRANLYGNLQVKCCRPEWAPWSSTGLYTYRKNPQCGHTVWGIMFLWCFLPIMIFKTEKIRVLYAI